MRSKKFGLRSKSTSTKRSKKLAESRRRIFEPLEARNLLAVSAGLFPGGEGPFEGPTTHGSGQLYLQPQVRLAETDGFLTGPSGGAPLNIALNYLRTNASQLGLTASAFDQGNFMVTDQYTSDNGVTHIYLRQKADGLEVLGADANVNVSKLGEIISVGSGFLNLNVAGVPSSQAAIPPTAAYSEFADEFNLSLETDPAILESRGGLEEETVLSTGGLASDQVIAEKVFVPVESGGVELAWRLNVPIINDGHWYDVAVSAMDGGLLQYADWVDNASYNVVPPPNTDPEDGGRAILVDPHDPVASPFGWHDINGLPGADFTDTRGNNVDAREDRAGNFLTTGAPLPTTRPNGGVTLDFDTPLNLTGEPFSYTDASVTNLFFWVNYNHDVFFRYGFNEAAGNFQSTNYTGTGIGNDPVLALAQLGDDTAAMNNAFMATPPDGTQPTIGMFTFDTDLSDIQSGNFPNYAPRRDGSFDNGIVTHEFAHGLTNRLTGGPANSGALNAQQSGSMGEGWSDFYALALTQEVSDLPSDSYPIGDYINGPNPQNANGGRRFPYSFDLAVNPLTFVDFNGGGDPTCATAASNCEVHNAGEIWAQTLWDMNFTLRNKYGFTSDLRTGEAGNTLAIQLSVDALKLQPANPTFLEARDAILQADLIRYKGVNHAEIWEAFARRGMGLSADADVTDVLGANSINVRAGFDVPQPVATISGTVFNDSNGNGIQDGNEQGIPGAKVFIDLDEDGNVDPLEPVFMADSNGNYSIELLTPGTFTIAQVPDSTSTQTSPAGGQGQQVDVAGGQNVSDVDFGNRAGGSQSTGAKFHDLDGNGRRDEGEPGVPNVWIYADFDGDSRLDLGEPAAKTDADGNYSLSLDRPGTYFVREVETPGWVQTFPGGDDQGHEVTVVNGNINVTFDFGNQAANDYGDAPDTYPVLAADNGAVHPMLNGFFLGAGVDGEGDGIPSTLADGDDTNQNTNDEDGVVFSSLIFPGGVAQADVTLSNGSFAPGRLNAWVDFNGDGDWMDAGEHIVHDSTLRTGTHNLTFNVPADAQPGLTYARFRYGYRRFSLGENPAGGDIAGEVEDYQIRVLAEVPDAMDDQFRVDQNSVANQLDVLNNDISSRSGPIFISSTTTPNRGGRVTISASGDSLSYSPNTGFSGVETFRYTVRDQAGNADTATVTVVVVPQTPAIAVDDSFDVLQNSSNNTLDVLRNDLAGQNPPISIVDVIPSQNSQISIDRGGTADPSDDRLLYTPNPGFAATDQFSYIIEDTAGVQDTATVTVHAKPGSLLGDIVEYRLETTDLTGNPIAAIGVGQQFLLRAFVDDLRADDGDGDPVDRRGIAGAYLDVLYDINLTSVGGAIQFGSDYQNATSGETLIPGLINEVGAFQTSLSPLGANEVLLFQIPMFANSVGSAMFTGDPADERSEVNPNTPDHDTLTFQPPAAVELQGMRFSDTMIQIIGSGGVPVAVDNTFTVAAGINENVLNVLGNDFDNGSPPLTVTSVTQGERGGAVRVGPAGQDVRYTPPSAGFVGVDSFTYTMRNGAGLNSSATVTVQVGQNAKGLNFRLQPTNLSGQPISQITVGSNFRLEVHIQDLRADDGDGDALDERGVFAAYTDLLYDSSIVSTIDNPTNPFGFEVTFSSDYDNGRSGDDNTPNLINELGAFQDGFRPKGTAEFLLATITLRAENAGTADFQIDPADLSPLHDSLFFEPDDQAVPNNLKVFASASITVTGGSAEGELTNPINRFDVNDDGSVTPMDPLGVINHLNFMAETGGEGEPIDLMYVDVSGDGGVSPIDALQVINYLNQTRMLAGEGEGELLVAATDDLPSGTSTALVVGPPTLGYGNTSTADSASELHLPPAVETGSAHANDQHTAGHDAAFAALDREASDDADEDDELLSTGLAEDVLGQWQR